MVSSIVERRTSSKQDRIQKFQFLFAVLRRTRSPYCSPLRHIANDNPTIPMSKDHVAGCAPPSVYTRTTSVTTSVSTNDRSNTVAPKSNERQHQFRHTNIVASAKRVRRGQPRQRRIIFRRQRRKRRQRRQQQQPVQQKHRVKYSGVEPPAVLVSSFNIVCASSYCFARTTRSLPFVVVDSMHVCFVVFLDYVLFCIFSSFPQR